MVLLIFLIWFVLNWVRIFCKLGSVLNVFFRWVKFCGCVEWRVKCVIICFILLMCFNVVWIFLGLLLINVLIVFKWLCSLCWLVKGEWIICCSIWLFMVVVVVFIMLNSVFFCLFDKLWVSFRFLWVVVLSCMWLFCCLVWMWWMWGRVVCWVFFIYCKM